MNTFDIGIIGAGVAGAYAALKIAKENKNIKTVLFDLGRPSGKRRQQTIGWFGMLPNSDGKFYMNDVRRVGDLVGAKRSKQASTWVFNQLNNIIKYKITEDRKLHVGLEKKIKKNEFSYYYNDYIQLYPKEIHMILKDVASNIEQLGNVTLSFDNEIYKVHKQRGMFVISSSEGEYSCKRLLICAGRSGWRWVTEMYNNFGIVESNDVATFGIHAEISSSYMKEFNKSACTIHKDDLEIGPLSWNGTVIPEDHVDLAISAFRSNENRWKSDKVSFKMIGHRKFEGEGFEQTARLGKLAFVLSNDRISKERINSIIAKRSKISVLPEYDWLIQACEEVSELIPEFINKGYFHIPTILTLPPKIKIGNNLSTEIDNMYVAGESAGISGLLAASIMGSVAADSITK